MNNNETLKMNNPNEPATDAVDRTAQEMLTAFEAKDAAKVNSYYAPDAIIATAGRPAAKDGRAVSKAIMDDLADPNFKMSLSHEKTEVAASGDLAYRRGSYKITATLPDVEAISGGKFNVPHFTGKAKIDRIVKEAGFAHHTFVIPAFFYQNLVGALAPQKQADGSVGWALPLDPDARCIHMGDITELGNIVAGAFAHPDQAGDGEYLPLVGDFMSFNEVVETLNRQGHEFSFKQVPKELFATLFPGAAAIAETFSYFQAHTYLGSDSSDRIALANKIAGRQPTKFSTWARLNVPVQNP